MDNPLEKTQNTQPEVKPVAPVTQETQTPQVIENQAVSPVSDVASMLAPENPSVKPAKKLNLPKIDPKNILPMIKAAPFKFKIMGGVVITLLVLLILASFTKPGKKVVERLILPSPSPVPTITPIGEVFVPSPYATDPELLDIQSRLGEFEKKLTATSLGNDVLRPQSLDFEIDFKQ